MVVLTSSKTPESGQVCRPDARKENSRRRLADRESHAPNVTSKANRILTVHADLDASLV
jgi:hypothetical protein